MDDKKRIVHNIDGEEIDLLQDDLAQKLTYESANFIRRMLAYLIDLLLVIVIWYLCSNIFLKEIDKFMETLGKLEEDFVDRELYLQLRDLVWKLFLNLYLAWIGAKAVYFTLVPAIIGDGRTIGKMVAGIGAVNAKTLEEASPSRLVLREIVGRCLIETLFIIPMIVSVFLAFFRKDSKSLHDLISKTVVIKFDLYKVE